MSNIPKGTMTLEQWNAEFKDQFEQPPKITLVCDECGFELSLEEDELYVLEYGSYCLQCGAKVYGLY